MRDPPKSLWLSKKAIVKCLLKNDQKKFLKNLLTSCRACAIMTLLNREGKGDKRNAERLGDVEQRYGFRIFPYKATSHKKIQKNKKKS